MPDPLFTSKVFEPLMKANEIADSNLEEKVGTVKKILEMIPDNNRIIIQKILELFKKIAENEQHNKMNPTNLATVLAPTVLYGSKDPMTMIQFVNQTNEVFTFFIKNYERLFPKPLFVPDTASSSFISPLESLSFSQNVPLPPQTHPLLASSKLTSSSLDLVAEVDKVMNLTGVYKLKICFKKGTQLASKDSNGFSDPFMTLSVENETEGLFVQKPKYKTKGSLLLFFVD